MRTLFFTVLLVLFSLTTQGQAIEIPTIVVTADREVERPGPPEHQGRPDREDRDRSRKKNRPKSQKTAPQAPPAKSIAQIKSEAAKDYNKKLLEIRAKLLEAFLKAELQKSINQNALADIQKIKADLLDYSSWRSHDGTLAAGIVASNINAMCDLVYNLMEIPPGSKAVVTGLDITRKSFEKAIQSGKIDANEISGVVGEMILADKLTSGNILLKMTNTFKELGQDIYEMSNLSSQQKEFKNEVKRQIESIDKEIERYQNAIQKSENLMREKERMLLFIDVYVDLNKNNILP